MLFLRFACPLLPNAARGVPSDDVPFDSWESRWECRGEPPVPPPEPRSSIVSSGAIVYELSWSGAEALFSDTAYKWEGGGLGGLPAARVFFCMVTSLTYEHLVRGDFCMVTSLTS